jgi:tetratricopeptide (TPR) repeat protein
MSCGSWAEEGIEYGLHDEAIADATEALRLNSRHALSFSTRALAKLRSSRFEEALADANKAIRLDPDLDIAQRRSWRSIA